MDSTIGLHINGRAEIVEHPEGVDDPLAERWVCVSVEEAYINCSKHIPRLQKMDQEIHWNTDDHKLKDGNYLEVKNPAEYGGLDNSTSCRA